MNNNVMIKLLTIEKRENYSKVQKMEVFQKICESVNKMNWLNSDEIRANRISDELIEEYIEHMKKMGYVKYLELYDSYMIPKKYLDLIDIKKRDGIINFVKFASI